MATRNIGFARWIYNDVTLDTIGDTSINIDYDTVEHKENEYGTSPTDYFYTGVRVTVEGFLAYSQANLIRAAGVLALTTTTEYQGLGATIAGVKGSDLAQSLVIHALAAGSTTTDDIRIHKAVLTTNGSIDYAAGEDDGRIPVIATALIDTSQTNGRRLFKLGADA